MEYTIICHDVCNWQSEPMSKDELSERGVPWYCDCCGNRAFVFVRGTLDELEKWHQQKAEGGK